MSGLIGFGDTQTRRGHWTCVRAYTACMYMDGRYVGMYVCMYVCMYAHVHVTCTYARTLMRTQSRTPARSQPYIQVSRQGMLNVRMGAFSFSVTLYGFGL